MKILRFFWKYKIGAICGGIYAISFIFVFFGWLEYSGLAFLFFPAVIPGILIVVPLYILSLVFGVDVLCEFKVSVGCTPWDGFFVSMSSWISFAFLVAAWLYLGALIEISVRRKIMQKFR